MPTRLHLLLCRPSLMSLIRNQFFSASPIYPDFTAALFFVFIFRALRPCDHYSPISEWKPVYLFRVRKGDSLLIHSFIRTENTPFCREKHLKIPDYLCGWLKLKKPFCFLIIISTQAYLIWYIVLFAMTMSLVWKSCLCVSRVLQG